MIKPVGSTKEINIDVRIVAATNEDLREACEKGDFREDLFHRLNEFMIEVPPLRERQTDIMIFAEHFLTQANIFLNRTVNGFDDEVRNIFMKYDWPGNLREMMNIVKRATLLTEGDAIAISDIPEELYENPDRDSAFSLYNSQNEKELILKALDVAGNNKSQAARLLKIDRKTLYNKLKLYHIELSDNSESNKS